MKESESEFESEGHIRFRPRLIPYPSGREKVIPDFVHGQFPTLREGKGHIRFRLRPTGPRFVTRK
jgi:hypothetical protein